MVLVNKIYFSKRLIKFWEKNSLKCMKKKNKDKVYIVDGMERTGKSTWAIQQMCYLEPSLLESPEKLVSRIVFSPEEFHKVCREVHNGCIVFDEAFRGLSSRGAMSKINKKLIQTLMEMGQRNNIVFIVLPRVFMLDIYPAMLRSNALFNIYEGKRDGRRYWRYYNYRDKNKIYQIGIKKGWDYVFGSKISAIFGRKFPGGDEFEKAYLEKKLKAFHSAEIDAFNEDEVKLEKEIAVLHDEKGLTFDDIAELKGFSPSKARVLYRKWAKSQPLSSNMNHKNEGIMPIP